MSHEANDKFFEAQRERAEEAGLIFVGRNEDGEPEFLGNNKEWARFNNGE